MTSQSNKELLNATSLGDLEVTNRLIREGADVNYKGIWGDTPLHKATEAGNEAIVSLLLKHGSLINKKNYSGWTPLHLAAKKGYKPVVSKLIRNNANVNEKTDGLGLTPLHLAAREGYEPVVSSLLRNNASVNETTEVFGNTPLHYAVRAGSKSIVSLLLAHGSLVNEKNSSGETALTTAKKHNYTEIAEMIKRVIVAGLPKELQYLTKHDGASFMSTLKSGFYHSHVGKVMCVGHEAVGKTAITSVLVNTKISKKRKPTEGIDLHTYKAAVDKDNKKWIPIVLDLEDVAFRDLVNEHAISKPQLENLLEDVLKGDFVTIATDDDDTGIEILGTPSPEEGVKNLEQKTKSDDNTTKKSVLQRIKQAFGMKKAKLNSIDALLQEAIRKGKKGLKDSSLAPINMMDFGGQSAFYSTHQSFLTYRGIYILVIDGSKDFDADIESENFIPGRHSKPTSREFVLFWVSSIEAYSKGSSLNFPKIIIVCTHKDQVPNEKADTLAERIFLKVEEMFTGTSAMEHLVLEHRIFLNARDPKDHGYNKLKEVLVDLLCSQPSWGEKLPKAWIHLKMMLNRMVENGETVISMESLKRINKDNPIEVLSEQQLIVFLKIQHCQGEIIYFPLPMLRDNIVISPRFLVDALRSLITDKMFCEGRRHRAIESLNLNGLLYHKDIDNIWRGKKKFIKHKKYLLSLMGHLDIIATPRQYGRTGNLMKCDIFYVPSLVKSIDDTDYLTQDLKTRSLGLSFKFQSRVLPPAIGYRLIASCLDLYEVRTYNGKTMLFSGLVVVKVNRNLDLVVILKSDRINIYLVHTSSWIEINRGTAGNISECLEDILVNILESYRVTSSEGAIKQVVPFQKEFPCFEISSPCYQNETERTTSNWTCKHEHTITVDMKSYWLIGKIEEAGTEKKFRRIEGTLHDDLSQDKLYKKPTDRQLANISLQSTKEEFYSMLIQLGLKKSEIDAIEEDYGRNLMNTKFLCLRKWRRKTNGSVQDIIKAAESQGIGVNWMQEIDRQKPILHTEDMLEMYPTDRILDSIANEVIHESLLLSVHLGHDASFWIRMKDDRYKIVEINREVLGKWRSTYKGDNIMGDLAQALCNVEVDIAALLPDF